MLTEQTFCLLLLLALELCYGSYFWPNEYDNNNIDVGNDLHKHKIPTDCYQNMIFKIVWGLVGFR